jgi:FkbM family methyltransferase
MSRGGEERNAFLRQTCWSSKDMNIKGATIKTARWIRDLGRPLWNTKVGRYTIWQHLSRLFYSLPIAPQYVRLSWGHTLWFPRGFSGRLEYLAGEYEPEVTQVVMERVREGMIVVDGGANIGYYTLLFSHLVGVSGKVYAFEPDPAMYQALLMNIFRNALSNVEAFDYALGKTSGMALFHALGGVGSGFAQDSDIGGMHIIVQVVALDSLLEGRERVDFVKLDVEGTELDCLEGMQNIIAKNPEILVIFEVNLNKLRMGSDALMNRLKELGLESMYAIEYQFHITNEGDLSKAFDRTIAQRRHVFNLLCARH